MKRWLDDGNGSDGGWYQTGASLMMTRHRWPRIVIPFLLIGLTLSLGTALDAHDRGYDQQKVQEVIIEKTKDVVKMASHPLIVEAVASQNALEMSLEEIKQRDEAWATSDDLSPLKRRLQENKAGAFLKFTVLRNRAIYSEAFLADRQGANVGAYPPTSDYWQGDEEKFTIAFNHGEGQLLITPVIFDESTATLAAQVAAPVYDEHGETIGVLFVGIKLSYAIAR